MTEPHTDKLTIDVDIERDPVPVQPVQILGTISVEVDGTPLVSYGNTEADCVGRFGDRVAIEIAELLALGRAIQADEVELYGTRTVGTTGTPLRLAVERLSGGWLRLAFQVYPPVAEVGYTPAPTAERGHLITRDALAREATACGREILDAAAEFGHDSEEVPLQEIREYLSHVGSE